jgi:hypothetical protein
MRLESGGERVVRDNQYIAVFMMSDVRLSLYFLIEVEYRWISIKAEYLENLGTEV